LAILKALEEYKPQSKLEWAGVENFNPGERDFRMILWRLREKNPDILYVYAFDPEMPIILRQLHESGWKIPVSTITMFDMEVDNPLIEGAWYVGSDSPSAEHRKWYTQTFHKVNAPYGSALYSDYMEMIYEACESYKGPGKPSREYIAAYLRNLKDFHGESGTVSCSPKGVFSAPPTLLKIDHGVVTPIEK
jgi:branched-chain amino acid transport system substrate-binding protein